MTDADPPHVQTKREIQSLLVEAGLRPKKRLGQHFLIDGNLMRRLVSCAELDRDCVVLEVGAGTGGLSDLLATEAAHLICVEIDPSLVTILSDRLSLKQNVSLVQADILAKKHEIAPEVLSELERRRSPNRPVRLVANLPYQVATPLIMNLLIDCPFVDRLCFTVQREVGERLVSPAGCKSYGPISIVSQVLCTVTTLCNLPPEAFWPRPVVDSVMIRMDVENRQGLDSRTLHRFTELVRSTFIHRRKTLHSALRHVLDKAVCEHVCRHFDGRLRPEVFTVDQWLDIFRLVDSKS